MHIFRYSPEQKLSEWVEIAVAKLALAAKERIRAEIEAHYNEAVDAHLDDGLPMSASHAAALEELGDAKVAARRFRRAHLTEREFRFVRRLLKSGRPTLIVHSGGFVSFLALCHPHRYNPEAGQFWMIGAVALFIVYEIVIYILARRKSPRLLVLIESAARLMVGVFWLDIALSRLHPDAWLGMAFLVPSLLDFAQSVFYFRLRNKLGKVG